MVAEFDAAGATDGEELSADYNVAPTKRVHVVRLSRRAPVSAESAQASESTQATQSTQASKSAQASESGADGGERRRVLDVVKWGLVPFWSKDPSGGARMLNARAESLSSKPAFRAAFSKRRCLVPADGWFEWTPREHAPGKQAFYMTPQDGSVLALAGLWEVWGEGEDRLYTCTIVTTEALGQLTAVHDRMPLVLGRDRWAQWLGEDEVADTSELLAPPSERLIAGLDIRPVGGAVGNVRNNGPQLLDPDPDAVADLREADSGTNQTLF